MFLCLIRSEGADHMTQRSTSSHTQQGSATRQICIPYTSLTPTHRPILKWLLSLRYDWSDRIDGWGLLLIGICDWTIGHPSCHGGLCSSWSVWGTGGVLRKGVGMQLDSVRRVIDPSTTILWRDWSSKTDPRFHPERMACCAFISGLACSCCTLRHLVLKALHLKVPSSGWNPSRLQRDQTWNGLQRSIHGHVVYSKRTFLSTTWNKNGEPFSLSAVIRAILA